MKFIIIAIIFTLAFFVNISAQEISEFSVGDTVISLKKTVGINRSNNFYLYIFADVNSCNLKMESMNNIETAISQLYELAVVMFVGGASQNDVDVIKEDFPSHWQLVPDDIFAYKSFYKVSTYPFYYILDNIRSNFSYG